MPWVSSPALCPTAVAAKAELLDVLGSGSPPVTLAVLTRMPPAVGLTVTLIVTVVGLPAAITPRVQVSVAPPRLHVGGPGEDETKVTPAGSASVRVTAVAVDGPALLTVTV